MTVLEEMLEKLEIRQVKSLYGHEQTISRSLKRLKEGMLNIGQLVDPLIVDKKTGVVLDGNHRLKVLEILECPHAVCQTVDYNSPEIEVKTWQPSLKITVDELTKLDSIKYEKVEKEEGMRAVDSLRAPTMAMTPENEYYLLNPGKYKLKEMIEEQKYVLGLIEDKGPNYIAEEQMEKEQKAGNTIFYRRGYTKEEIINSATEHTPLPPKSTRHLIPERIIRLNMRLGWLHLDAESAQKELTGMLKKRAYNGNVRRYYEPVIVIY